MNIEDYLFVDDGVKYWLGPVNDIVSLVVSGNYTEFFFSNGQKLLNRGSLNGFEAKLPSSIFFRANRDCLINLKHVLEMRLRSSKQLEFTLTGGSEIIMSRQQSLLFRRTRKL